MKNTILNLTVIFSLTTLNFKAQSNDVLFFYFPMDKNGGVTKKWEYDFKSEKIKIANKLNDSVIFVSRESYIKKHKPKKNIIYIDDSFEYDFLSFFRKIEGKKIVIVLSYERKYRYIIVNEIFQYEKAQE